MRYLALLLTLACACGDDDSPTDGGGDAPSCTESSECDDGAFCNGVESCVSGTCAAGTPPCAAESCDEASDRCSTCIDADGDGQSSVECGGTDCDDSDPRRFPGNPEICDVDDVDEDCDPATYGRRDIDGDDVTDIACCNGDNCGEDCDDNRAGIFPTATETCNGLDDDCDGTIDEGVGATYTIDADGDGFGAVDGETIVACTPPDGYALTATDCDDSAPAVNPGNDEVCDPGMVDENCDGLRNPPEDCSCTAGEDPRDCTLPGVCADGVEMCIGGMWGACSIAPAAVDICDGRDEDCNGVADDPFMCARDSVRPCVTACGTEGTQTCDEMCRWGACAAVEVCNGCDDDADGTPDDGFECALGGAPTACTNSCGNMGTAECTTGCMLDTCIATEVCDYCDDDGDGTTDDELLDATTTTITVTPPTAPSDACNDLRITSPAPADVFCSGGQMQFVDFSGSDTHEIGAWLMDPLQVGYGPVTIDVDLFVALQAGEDPGWGMGYVLGAGRPRSLAGGAGMAGIPTDYSGVAFEHAWKSDDMFTGDLDSVRLHLLRGSLTRPTVLATSPIPPAAVVRIDAGGSSFNKRLIIRITYDRGNSVTGRPRSVSMHACEYMSGDPGNPPCDPLTEILSYEGPEVPDIGPGRSLYFGVTHGARNRGRDVQAKVRWWHRQPLHSENSCLP